MNQIFLRLLLSCFFLLGTSLITNAVKYRHLAPPSDLSHHWLQSFWQHTEKASQKKIILKNQSKSEVLNNQYLAENLEASITKQAGESSDHFNFRQQIFNAQENAKKGILQQPIIHQKDSTLWSEPFVSFRQRIALYEHLHGPIGDLQPPKFLSEIWQHQWEGNRIGQGRLAFPIYQGTSSPYWTEKMKEQISQNFSSPQRLNVSTLEETPHFYASRLHDHKLQQAFDNAKSGIVSPEGILQTSVDTREGRVVVTETAESFAARIRLAMKSSRH